MAASLNKPNPVYAGANCARSRSKCVVSLNPNLTKKSIAAGSDETFSGMPSVLALWKQCCTSSDPIPCLRCDGMTKMYVSSGHAMVSLGPCIIKLRDELVDVP